MQEPIPKHEREQHHLVHIIGWEKAAAVIPPVNQVNSVGGDLQAVFHGKVELFQDDTFLTDGKAQPKLLASAGTAVIVVHHKDHCGFVAVPL